MERIRPSSDELRRETLRQPDRQPLALPRGGWALSPVLSPQPLHPPFRWASLHPAGDSRGQSPLLSPAK